MQTGTRFLLVTAYCTQKTNQHAGKQGVGICSGAGMLCGHKAEVSLVDYFLERRVTDVQNALTNFGVWGVWMGQGRESSGQY